MIVFQNYQRQKRDNATGNKQSVIDIVNFNMKSLNINVHWDSMLIKIVPNLQNSPTFAKTLVYSALSFIKLYFQLTSNFDGAAKLVLMLSNARNSFIVNDLKIKKLIEVIKNMIYP